MMICNVSHKQKVYVLKLSKNKSLFDALLTLVVHNFDTCFVEGFQNFSKSKVIDVT